jgi:hypothetical protein
MEIVMLVLEVLRRSLPRCLAAAGPYLLVEILLPGGSLLALALYLYRHRKSFFEALSIRRLADRP